MPQQRCCCGMYKICSDPVVMIWMVELMCPSNLDYEWKKFWVKLISDTIQTSLGLSDMIHFKRKQVDRFPRQKPPDAELLYHQSQKSEKNSTRMLPMCFLWHENTTCCCGSLCPDFIFMMTSSNGNIFCITGPLWGEPPVTGGFPSQMPVTLSFDVFFDLCLNKRLNKQSRHRWFETPSCSLWCHYNADLDTQAHTHTHKQPNHTKFRGKQ